MKKLKVLTAFGTRPDAIKMCPLARKLREQENIESRVLVTAQHRQMLDRVLELFGVVPDYDLDIMAHGQTITDITSRVLYGCEKIFEEYEPDIVLVHGDTTTSFAVALASFYRKIPVGHVEAGLRTENIYSPFPEEMNRRLTARIAKVHFAATASNVKNLMKENISRSDIVQTGNTVIDALKTVVKDDYVFEDPSLQEVLKSGKKLLLMTCHRRENWGKPMEQIFSATRKIVDENPEVQLVFPMHLNPLVRESAKKYLDGHPRILLTDPLDYQPMANMMRRSFLVMTDSGGIQEEAPAFGVPVMVLRTETERPEAVQAGTVKVVGIESEVIREEGNRLIRDRNYYDRYHKAINPYGDGKASERIVKALLCKFGYDTGKMEEFGSTISC